MARLSNFELLRIAALMLIVGIHISADPLKAVPISSANWYVANLIDSLCRPGVNLFVLVGAYFMMDMKRLDSKVWKRVWRIVYPLAIYILVLSTYVIFLEETDVGWLAFLQSILNGKLGVIGPIWYGHLWFIYPYLILIVISPILNMVIDAADRRTFHYILAILLTFFVVFPTINDYARMSLVYVPISSTALFITLYFSAAYIRRFNIKMRSTTGVIIFLVCGILISILTWYYTDQTIPSDASPHGLVVNFYHYNGILVYLASITLFLAFKSVSLQNRYVNLVGRSTYDAYLIHTVFIFVLFSWVGYTDYFTADVITFTGVTLGLIALTTGLSLLYGILRSFMDKWLSNIWNRARAEKVT
jgi:surface polysaccharide O-acyltransferase-like enzyme